CHSREDALHGKIVSQLIAGFLLATALASPNAVAGAQSQATTGTIEGSMTDQSGAVLPGVSISIKSVETGVVRTLLSDDQGFFRAPLLPVGRYDLTAEFTG